MKSKVIIVLSIIVFFLNVNVIYANTISIEKDNNKITKNSFDNPGTLLNTREVNKKYIFENFSFDQEGVEYSNVGERVNVSYKNKEYSVDSITVYKNNNNTGEPHCMFHSLLAMGVKSSNDYSITYQCPKCSYTTTVFKRLDITNSVDVLYSNGNASFTMPDYDVYVDIHLKKNQLYNGIGNVKTELYRYNAVRINWTPDSNSYKIEGYYVYYKEGNNNYKYLGKTSDTFYSKSILNDGIKYYFKISPYYIDSITGKAILGNNSFDSIYTLKKIEKPIIKKKGKKFIKIKWKKINGTSGYEISRSKKTSKTHIIKRVNSDYGSYKIKSKKYKKYYYKVRAYKIVNGSKIYGPWSKSKKYILK